LITVKYDGSDWENFYDVFMNQRQKNAIDSTKPILVNDIQDHFEEKTNFSRGWADHTKDYKIWMKRHNGKVNPLLNQSGALMNRMKYPRTQNNQGDGARFVFEGKGKTAKYAHIHNNYPMGFWVKYPYGNKNIGKRRIANRKFGWVSFKATDNIISVWSKIR